MADKHPYMSGNAGLIQAVGQLRKAFPSQITADTLKKLGIAPNNESVVINILRFVGTIDSEGKKTDAAASTFSQHDDAAFQASFSDLVQNAYAGLFELHSDSTWNLPSDKLISYFRSTDHTSAIVGQRQAGTFQSLASLAGHLDTSSPKSAISAKQAGPKAVAPKKQKIVSTPSTSDLAKKPDQDSGNRQMALSVRIEINLPVAPDQDTYDRIFRSIRENLMNG